VPTKEEEVIVVYQRPKDPEPEPVQRVERTQPTTTSAPPAGEVVPRFDAPPVVLDHIPPISTTSSIDPIPFDRRAVSIAGDPAPRGPAVPAADSVFSHETVERAVALLPGNHMPRYPSMLQAAGVEGTVVMQFVVDTTGRVERGSARAIRSDHALFERAVLDALPRMRFSPAEVDGRKVRQLVEQAFGFVKK
jgi:protein TonB